MGYWDPVPHLKGAKQAEYLLALRRKKNANRPGLLSRIMRALAHMVGVD